MLIKYNESKSPYSLLILRLLIIKCAHYLYALLRQFPSTVLTSLRRSKASFNPFILLRSLAFAATRLCLRIVGLGGLVDFFRPPRPLLGGVGLPFKLTGEFIDSPETKGNLLFTFPAIYGNYK